MPYKYKHKAPEYLPNTYVHQEGSVFYDTKWHKFTIPDNAMWWIFHNRSANHMHVKYREDVTVFDVIDALGGNRDHLEPTWNPRGLWVAAEASGDTYYFAYAIPLDESEEA